jgi:hypothetical protein
MLSQGLTLLLLVKMLMLLLLNLCPEVAYNRIDGKEFEESDQISHKMEDIH